MGYESVEAITLLGSRLGPGLFFRVISIVAGLRFSQMKGLKFTIASFLRTDLFAFILGFSPAQKPKHAPSLTTFLDAQRAKMKELYSLYA